MTLLDWLYHYRHQLGIDLVLAHVNHHQRIEADQEERGIRALAEAKHLPLRLPISLVLFLKAELDNSAMISLKKL